jgi:osmotically-inducible protein OsmY
VNTAALEVGIGKEVVCDQDVVGRVERLITTPRTPYVSQVVVKTHDRSIVLPLEAVQRTDDGVAYLSADGCDLDAYPTYIPPNVSLGTQVTSTDGPVGRVHRVVLDRQTGAVSHIVVRVTLGFLVPRDVVIPLAWARSITSTRVELAVSRNDVLQAPEFRSDDEIAVELLRRLSADPRFQGIDQYTHRIDVYGGLVLLSGRVRSCALKLAAQELALTTPGVLSVDNQLIADEELVRNVERALQGEGVAIQDLEVSALLGRVTLRGVAATADVIEKAERLAREVRGIASVVNELTLRIHS